MGIKKGLQPTRSGGPAPTASQQLLASLAGKAGAGAGTDDVGGDGGAHSRYVPTFLRSRRKNVVPAPPLAMRGSGRAQFEVPAFSSSDGYVAGVYDEDTQTTHFG